MHREAFIHIKLYCNSISQGLFQRKHLMVAKAGKMPYIEANAGHGFKETTSNSGKIFYKTISTKKCLDLQIASIK